MRVIVDVDGVLADMHTKMLDIYNHENNADMKVTDITQWDLKPELSSIFKRPGFFQDLPLIPNAIGFLNALDKLCDIVIASSPTKTPHIAHDKMIWVHTYLPTFADRFCLTENKNIFDADVLLDDYDGHVSVFNGELALLMNQPWNECSPIPEECRVDTLADALYKIVRYQRTGGWL